MSGYTLGLYNFVRWEGPRPQLVKQHVREFTRPGVNGMSSQLLGVHGDPFTVQLTSVYQLGTDALSGESGHRQMVGGLFRLYYEGLDYARVYGNRFLVHDVVNISLKRHPFLIGPGYSYLGGFKVVTQFTLISQYTAG